MSRSHAFDYIYIWSSIQEDVFKTIKGILAYFGILSVESQYVAYFGVKTNSEWRTFL